MSSRVDIEKDKFSSLKFPSICPVCGSNTPNDSLKMRTYFSANQPLNEALGADWNIALPVCTQHKKNIILGRWMSWLLFVGLMLLVAVILIILLPYLDGQAWFIVVGVLVVLIGLALLIQQKLYVAPLLMESFSYRLLFTFRDDDLAEKFAQLNGIDTVYSSMNQARSIKPANQSQQD